MSDKQLVLEALRKMPEDATLDEIQEELAILAALREAEAELDAGQGIPHEEVKQRAAEWLAA